MTDQRQNRIQSFAFVLSACVAFCLAYCFTPHIINFNNVSDREFALLNNQINPNTAEVESLIRLPDIGFSRADAIVQYRDSFVENNNVSAFKTPNDLENIKGIGPKTIQNMKDLLKFE
jgi:competence ComEA-like helix-hairpin-helix protein